MSIALGQLWYVCIHPLYRIGEPFKLTLALAIRLSFLRCEHQPQGICTQPVCFFSCIQSTEQIY
jgi:hypothetical protein